MTSASAGGRNLCSVASARAGGWRVIAGREDAALDLDARRGGLALGQGAGGAFALDLGQLVAIDRELAVEPAGRILLRAQERDQQDGDRDRGEEGEQEFQHQRSSSASRRRCSSSLSGCGAARPARWRRRAASSSAPPAISSSNGAPSHSTRVPVLKGGFSST